MSAIEVYSPRDSDLHLTLPHDHANSPFTTSPFTYKLDEEFDFVEVFPLGDRTNPQVALDPMLVDALFWAIHSTKQLINRATRGAGEQNYEAMEERETNQLVYAVPSVGVSSSIPDELFENMGMKKPKLVTLLERTDINPLRCFGDRFTLTQIVHGLQQLGCEAIDWMIEARWRSRLMGERSLWDWEDPRTLCPLSALSGHYQLLARPVCPSPVSSYSGPSAPSSPADSVVSIPPSSPAYIPLPFDNQSSASSSPTNSPFHTAPNSPGGVELPFSTGEGAPPAGREEEVELMLQLVLHPTASRYALRYPLANVFNRLPLIENGYVGSEEECAMDVDED